MQYQLKQCTEEDREWAYALKSEAYREVVERQFGPWDEKFQHELFSNRWNPTISKIVLIDDMAVGLVAVEDRRDELWLDEVQVAREWRGKGLGSAIVGDLLHRARTGRKPLKLQVLKKNTRAQNLYGRLGFSVTGETETHILMENRDSCTSVNTRTWLNAEKTYEGFPLFLRRPAKLDVGLLRRRFSKLLIVTHQFSKRLPNGLPDPDYNDSLRSMDGDLASLFDSEQSGVIVLVETFGGKRHYYYYVSSDGDATSTVDRVIRKYPGEQLSWTTKSDPRWSFLDRYSKEHF